MNFNSKPSYIMLMDINSCFATIEQQANPNLREKPVVVAAYQTAKGTILAASVTAKKLGIKTGMRVSDAKRIYPKVIVLSPDPPKYRDVHNKLYNLLLNYTNKVEPKSIDEFILDLEGYPCLNGRSIFDVAKEIKKRIKNEIGDYITVSIGIAPNRYLAKVAAGMIKPDGLVEINKDNHLDVYSSLKLIDLTGIKNGMTSRLNGVGIYTVMDFYNASYELLKIGLKKAAAHSWYLRLRGHEIDAIPWGRKSFGNEVSLKISKNTDTSPIIARLFEKARARARNHGYKALKKEVFISDHKIAVKIFDLIENSNLQLDLFGQEIKKDSLEKTIDKINDKWGNFVVGSARGFMAKDKIKDRISFHHLS